MAIILTNLFIETPEYLLLELKARANDPFKHDQCKV